MPTWPSELTYDEEGYGYTVTPSLSRSEAYSGLGRQRLKQTTGKTIFTVNITTDNTGFATFKYFVLNTLSNGEDTYTGPYYIGDYEETGELRIIDGTYTADYLDVGNWRINFSFEVVKRSYSVEESVYTYVDLYGFDSSLLDALENAIGAMIEA